MRFALLGPLEVHHDGTDVRVSAAMERALLARLLVDAGRIVPMDVLIEDLWDGSAPSSAVQAVRVYVSRVRKLLAEAAGRSLLQTRAPGYVLDLAPEDAIDARLFEASISDATKSQAAGRHEQASHAFGQALSLWRGPACVDIPDVSFVRREADRLEQLRLTALECKAVSWLATGRHADVAAELAAVCREHPEREGLWGAWMLALYRSKRQTEAVAAYAELRARLDEELGVEPSPEIAALYVSMLQQQPELDSPNAALPTGEVTFLLTDLEGSTRLWEEDPDAMGRALAAHDELVARLVQIHGGVVVKSRGEGDSSFIVFGSAEDAARGALAVQGETHTTDWPTSEPLRIRMAMHTGVAELRDGDYFGSVVNRTARLRSAAHGGQIVVTQSVVDAIEVLPEGAELVNLGAHTLRDLVTPERVWQLGRADLPSAFPPLVSLTPGGHNLPAQTTSFIGREAEVAHVARLIEEHRLVTLLGPGGTGKTRMSVQVAAQSAAKFPDGVWFVSLESTSAGSSPFHAFFTAFGLREDPSRDHREVLVSYLRGMSALLVVDNCEQVIDEVTLDIGALLTGCPELVILTTSRQRLGLAGEAVYAVPPLDVPPDGAPSSTIADAASVRLFVERARALNGSFELTADNMASVVSICRVLEGLPLAIELAAARVHVMPVATIAERIGHGLKLLSRGTATLERHATMRAAIDWSYQLLSEDEQRMLARLSAFSGGWTLEAADQVCAAAASMDLDDVLDLLSALAERSLVRVDTFSEPARYDMYATIRGYAAEQLAALGEEVTVRRAHQAWCQGFVDELGSVPAGDRDKAWLDQMEDELDNIRVALDRPFADPQDHARLTLGLAPFWATRGYTREARQRLDAIDEEPLEGVLLHQVLWWRAHFTSLLSDFASAEAQFQALLARVRASGDAEGEVNALNGLASTTSMRGDFPLAVLRSREALSFAREHGVPSDVARALSALAQCTAFSGHHDEAREAATEMLALGREHGLRLTVGEAMDRLAGVEHLTGRYEQAYELWSNALSIATEVGDKRLGASYLTNMGSALTELGKHDEGNALKFRALAICREVGDRKSEANTLGNIGVTYLNTGRYDEARTYLDRSLALAREIGADQVAATKLAALGALANIQDDHEAAFTYAQEAIELGRRLDDPSILAQGFLTAAECLRVRQRWTQAKQHYLDAIDVGQRFENHTIVVYAHSGLGFVLMNGEADHLGALGYFEEGLDLALSKNLSGTLGTLLSSLASLADTIGKPEPAVVLMSASEAATVAAGIGVPEATRVEVEVMCSDLRAKMSPDRYEELWALGATDPVTARQRAKALWGDLEPAGP